MSGGIVHPDGCRCPGCLPGQYVMRPAAPPRLRQNNTVQRRTSRPPQRNTGGDAGIIGPVILIGGIVFLTLCWPALVWHGYGGPMGTDWRWDIHSTIACLVYWGVLIFIAGMIWLGNKPAKHPRPPKGRLQVEATPQPPVSSASTAPQPVPVPQPPLCLHLNAVKVPSVLDRSLIYRCWCPDCDPDCKAPLPANFRRPCCGTEPETPHLWNCPQAQGAP